MCKQNQAGPALLGVLREPPALQPEVFARRITEGALVVDCRAPEAFAGTHIPGALNVGAGASFPTWAGSILPDDVDALLVVDDPDRFLVPDADKLPEDAPELAGVIVAWQIAAEPLGTLPLLTPRELDTRRRENNGLFILDVCQPAEWQAGHVPDAHHISGSDLPGQLEDVPGDRPVAVYCGSGYRSSVAASLLRNSGHRNVYNVIGGFTAWEAEQLPVEKTH